MVSPFLTCMSRNTIRDWWTHDGPQRHPERLLIQMLFHSSLIAFRCDQCVREKSSSASEDLIRIQPLRVVAFNQLRWFLHAGESESLPPCVEMQRLQDSKWDTFSSLNLSSSPRMSSSTPGCLLMVWPLLVRCGLVYELMTSLCPLRKDSIH